MTVDGLVIREKMLSNDNRLVTILTGEHGLVRAFVRSVKKLGGTMAAATDLFSYSSFTLFYNKDQYSADGAEPLRIFYHLREDLEKTSLASYLAQLAEELVPQGEPAPEQLKLFLNCLYLLEEDKRTVDFIKPVFELRLLTMSGYMPDLVGCQGCGEYEATAQSRQNHRGFLAGPAGPAVFVAGFLSPAAADYPLAAAIVAKATDNRDTGT